MRARLASLWNVQPGVEHPEELYVTVRIRLNPDRRLAAPPQVVSTGSSPRYQAAADAAVRAVLQGQPYTMLRDETYEQWKYMDIDFDPKADVPQWMILRNEPAMSVTSFSLPPLPLSRRDVLIGGAGAARRLAAAVAGRRADQIADHRRQRRAAADRAFRISCRDRRRTARSRAGVAQVITNNLRRSGLFAPIDPAAFIEKIVNIDAAPQFQSWKNHQRAGAGHRPHDPPERRAAEGRIPPVGRRRRPAARPASNTSPRRKTGAASRTSSPTRSTSA